MCFIDKSSSFGNKKLTCTFLITKVFRDVWIRFRLGISDLYVHKFRYNSMPYPTLCPLCDEEEEDEQHFVLTCPATYDIRRKYLFSHIQCETLDPLVSLLTTKETFVIRNVAMYLYYAFKRRADAVESKGSDEH